MTSPTVIAKLRAEVGELIARHSQTQDIASFARYANDPAGFMREVLRCHPWAKQEEMAEMVRDNPRSVVVTANGLGKDWVTARIALWWVFARSGFVILTGPTERQVREILMRELRKAFAAAPELPGELYALSLRVDDAGECGLLAFTSPDADKLTGFHHPRLLICVTEGQGCEEPMYEAAAACCTGPENRLFVYGNPIRPTGPFYRVANSDNWTKLTIRADEHPNVITGREEIPGAVSREFIANIREEYGEGSSVYLSRVLAQFPTESIEGLIKRAWIRAAFDRFDAGVFEEEAWNHRPILALDIARFGPDASALAVIQGPLVRELITWHNATVTDSVDRMIQAAERVGAPWRAWAERTGLGDSPPLLVIDEPGLGGGCVDEARRRGWVVEPYNGGARAVMHWTKRFFNKRAQSHWRFRELLEQGKVALPRDTLLEEEAMAIEWTTTPKGEIQILSKDLVRKNIGRSPDRLDCAVMGLGYGIGQLRNWAVAGTYYI